MLRFLAFDFLARMWLPYARSRISFPVPEILMRFAVPLCVLSFGIYFLSLVYYFELLLEVRAGNRGSRKLLLPNSDC